MRSCTASKGHAFPVCDGSDRERIHPEHGRGRGRVPPGPCARPTPSCGPQEALSPQRLGSLWALEGGLGMRRLSQPERRRGTRVTPADGGGGGGGDGQAATQGGPASVGRSADGSARGDREPPTQAPVEEPAPTGGGGRRKRASTTRCPGGTRTLPTIPPPPGAVYIWKVGTSEHWRKHRDSRLAKTRTHCCELAEEQWLEVSMAGTSSSAYRPIEAPGAGKRRSAAAGKRPVQRGSMGPNVAAGVTGREHLGPRTGPHLRSARTCCTGHRRGGGGGRCREEGQGRASTPPKSFGGPGQGPRQSQWRGHLSPLARVLPSRSVT